MVSFNSNKRRNHQNCGLEELSMKFGLCKLHFMLIDAFYEREENIDIDFQRFSLRKKAWLIGNLLCDIHGLNRLLDF